MPPLLLATDFAHGELVLSYQIWRFKADLARSPRPLPPGPPKLTQQAFSGCQDCFTPFLVRWIAEYQGPQPLHNSLMSKYSSRMQRQQKGMAAKRSFQIS